MAFYPDISPRSFRTTELTAELARQGHSVTVYAPIHDKESSAFAQQHGFVLKNLGRQRLAPIPVSGNRFFSVLLRALRRLLLMLFVYPDIELVFTVPAALKDERGYDLLISVAAPHTIHWGARLAIRNNEGLCKKWVADCGDPFMGRKTDTFAWPFYFKYIEKWCFRRADYITVPNEEAVSSYYTELKDKIEIIPQGFDFNKVPVPAYQAGNAIPTFAYAGYFIKGKRDPSTFLEYLCSTDKKFKFIVYTMDDSLLAPYKKKMGGRLEVRGYIAREKLLPILAGMDFLVNFGNSVPGQRPSKLIDYALTGRPILHLECRDLDTGLIDEFLGGDYSHKFVVEDLENYNIVNVARKFIALCSKKAASNDSGLA